MSLNWFRITQDNHLLIDAAFSGPGQHLTFDHPEEFRYLSLSDGSMVWSLPIAPKSGFTSEGNGQTLVLGNGAFYSIGGPSGGDISATSLSNHQQTWNVPSSGSYEKLYLENDVLLAWSGSGKNILTALSTQNGKQLWQVTKPFPVPTPTVVSSSSSSQTQSIQNIAIAGQSVFVEQREYITRDGIVNALDLHTGKQQWSMTIPGSSTITEAVMP
jgi:outer membrane protein assembly factor BamB